MKKTHFSLFYYSFLRFVSSVCVRLLSASKFWLFKEQKSAVMSELSLCQLSVFIQTSLFNLKACAGFFCCCFFYFSVHFKCRALVSSCPCLLSSCSPQFLKLWTSDAPTRSTHKTAPFLFITLVLIPKVGATVINWEGGKKMLASLFQPHFSPKCELSVFYAPSCTDITSKCVFF